MIKNFIYFLLLFVLLSCSNKTIYSGKIINQDNFNDLNFKEKSKLINKLGEPSYIDSLENKYFYFSEKKIKKSILNKNTEYSYVFVFQFDKNDQIIKTNVIDLKNSKNLKSIEEETQNEIVKRGIIEKIFGGVGSQQELPTSP